MGLNPPIRGSIEEKAEEVIESFCLNPPIRGSIDDVIDNFFTDDGLSQSPYKGFNRTR